MADTESHVHGHDDPNAAPMRQDVVFTFGESATVFCYLLALVTLVAGIVAGFAFVE